MSTDAVENAEMCSLVATLNKLQDATALLGGQSPIDLPQICVVGSQSSGKSSVLENIVGRSFLPRGSGIVTRRPLVLMMLQTPGAEYAEFTHRAGERFTTDAAIRAEIEADTDRECGANKGLNAKPINLRFYSPRVPNLTLIDLPGIAQNPVGDQPDDIGAQIREMVLDYARRPNCILLAVSAANTDLANSDAVAIARQVDPEGSRTLGVLTKLDLMDRGTDASGLLEGRGIDTRPGKALGYVGVVNRSQKDIDDGTQLVAARQHELRYFSEHEAYAPPALCHPHCGTAQLVARCTRILQRHIRTVLPRLTTDLSRTLSAKRARLARLKAEQDPETRDRLRMGALVAYSDAADALVRGLTHSHTRDARTLALLSSGELVGGAKIEELLSGVFTQELQGRDVFALLGPAEILKLAKNMSGLGGGLLDPSRAFDAVVVRYVRSLEEVCLRCVGQVRAELSQLLRDVRLDALACFPPLEEAVKARAEAVLAAEVGGTEDLVHTLVRMEACRVNLHHHDFAGNPATMSRVMEEVRAELTAFQQGTLGPPGPLGPPARAANGGNGGNGGSGGNVANGGNGGDGGPSATPPRGLSLMEGGVARLSEESPRGLGSGLPGSGLPGSGLPGMEAWQERHLVLGRDRVLRVYRQRADMFLDKQGVVGLDQLPESIMLHGAKAEQADEAGGRPHSVWLRSAGKQKELVFACSSPQEAAAWARALSQAAEDLGNGPSSSSPASARLSASELLARRISVQELSLPRAPGSASTVYASSVPAVPAAVAAHATDAADSELPLLTDASWPAQVAHLQLSSGELYEWGLMYKLLRSYTRLVQKTLADLIPKAITHRLVDSTLDNLRIELLRAFGSGSSSTDALMVVSEEAEKEYRDTEALVQTLSEYESVLRQVAVAGSGSAGER